MNSKRENFTSNSQLKTSVDPVIFARNIAFGVYRSVCYGVHLRGTISKASARVISRSITYPLSTIFSRILFEGIRGNGSSFDTMKNTFDRIVQERGYLALYDGFPIVIVVELLRALVETYTDKAVARFTKSVLRSTDKTLAKVAYQEALQPMEVYLVMINDWVDGFDSGKEGWKMLLPGLSALAFAFFEGYAVQRSIFWRLSGSVPTLTSLIPTPGGLLHALVGSLVGQDFAFMI